jgi:glycosyltransferase involved in cell wall biosynthesis
MKIIQVTHSFYPKIGGIENHLYELANQLSNKNEVRVYVADSKRRDEWLGSFLVRRYPSFKVPFTPVNLSPWLAWDLLFETGDIYHSHGFFSPYPLLAAGIALMKRKPFFFTFHGYPQPSQLHLSTALWIYEMAFEPLFLGITTKIISVSHNLPPKFRKYGKQIVFIPNGVCPDLRCDHKFSSQKRITYIGRLAKDKRVEMLIGAVSRLKGSGLVLQICGNDFGARHYLERTVKKVGVRTEFRELPYKRIWQAYCISKAVVLPSRYEGQPLVWLESVAYGRPIFSTRVGDSAKFFPMIFGKNSEYFLFDDEQELFEKLSDFLKNESKYAGIMKMGRVELMKKFSWKNVARKTQRLYSQAVRVHQVQKALHKYPQTYRN